MDPLLCATLLTHAIAVGMGAHQRSYADQRLMGSLPEALAMELICSGAFTRTGNPGNLLGRTLLLFRDYGARVTEPLRASPLELVEDALGMPLLQALAIGFYYYGAAIVQTDLRADLAVPRNAHVDQTRPGALDAFLDLFAGTVDDLAAAAAANRHDWQNLHLQERPLLRLGDRVLVLDETFLLERLTTGLFFLVVEHERAIHGEAAQQLWRKAYAEMHEMLVENYLAHFAPLSRDGTPPAFDEHDLQRVYDKRGTKGGGRADFGIDFGDVVVLAEAMSGQLSVGTREAGDREQLIRDLKRMVVDKAGQLVGTFNNITRSPQPQPGLLAGPAPAVHEIIITGGQFPGEPQLARFIDTLLRAEAPIETMMNDARCRSLRIVDLRDLEHAEAIRTRDHRNLPELLTAWTADEIWGNSSLSDWLIATDSRPNTPTDRPALLEAPLHEVFEAVESILLSEEDRRGVDWQNPD